MDDIRLGTALRAVRIRRALRQADVAKRAQSSRWQVSRIERGALEDVGLATARRIARSLDATIDVRLRWQGADLDRLLNARHSRLQETAIALLQAEGWDAVPEVSYSYFGERGVVDVLARRQDPVAVLVVELKTDIVDLGDLMGTVDRKRRLAPRIARDRGWRVGTVGVWVAVLDTRTNRTRLAAHATTLRAAYPEDGRTVRAWLRRPAKPLSALGFLQNEHPADRRGDRGPVRRVRLAVPPSQPKAAERG